MSFELTLQRSNLLGAMLALTIFALTIGVFVARLVGKSRIEYGFGLALVVLIIPLVYLLVSASRLDRPGIYFLWISLMIAFLLVELLVDYVHDGSFRQVRWQAIAYVMLFFGSTGGMIGVASLAGRPWGFAAIVGFLAMAVLAFVQRRMTGQ